MNEHTTSAMNAVMKKSLVGNDSKIKLVLALKILRMMPRKKKQDDVAAATSIKVSNAS